MLDIAYILLAVFTGVLTAFCRTCNGRLSMNVGPFKASLVNHVLGFLLLSLILLFWSAPVSKIFSAPPYAYLGGIVGALYVAVNSYVIYRLGTLVSGLLVISGQMIAGVLLSSASHNLYSMSVSFVGIIVIVAGVYLLNKGTGDDPDDEQSPPCSEAA